MYNRKATFPAERLFKKICKAENIYSFRKFIQVIEKKLNTIHEYENAN
jgi:hypothetical protein